MAEIKLYALDRTLTQGDFDRFAQLSGDDNPIHVDPDFARRTRFGKPVAHGMFLYSLAERLIEEHFPNRRAVEAEMIFPTPTCVEETIAVILESQIASSSGELRLAFHIQRASGEYGCQGATRLAAVGMMAASRAGIAGIPQSEVTSYKGLQIGQRAELQRAYTREDVQVHDRLVGGINPLNQESAESMRQDSGEVPGSLLGGMISCLLGTVLPGRGTNWLKQRFIFTAAARPAEPVIASVEVVRLRPEKDLVNLYVICTGAANRLLCTGEALVSVRDLENRKG